MKIRHLPFWLFSLSLILLLTISVLVQDGMFMDAVLYCAVAHNESIGVGNFWFPQYSALNIAGLASFHEQPPLLFGIVAVFYKLFGDSLYVERFYTLLTLCITIFLIIKLWNTVFSNANQYKDYSWIAIVLWIIIPCCYWAYSNNMCENTMGIFSLLSVLITYRVLESGKSLLKQLLFSGLFIFLGTFTKGMPALFPVAVPFIYWLLFSNSDGEKKYKFGTVLLHSCILLLVPVIAYSVLFSIRSSRESLSIYFFQRALYRMGNVPTVSNRFSILFDLFCQLLPSIILVLIIWGIAKLTKIKFSKEVYHSQAFFFVLTGIAASMPLMLTMVQKDIYLIPSFPYFAIGLALFVVPTIANWVDKATDKVMKAITNSIFVLLVFSIGFTSWRVGQTNREVDILHDVYEIRKIVPKFSVMTVPVEMYDEYDFVLQGFLVRYDNISIDPYKQHDYYFKDKKLRVNVPSGYKIIPANTVKYELYRRE